MESPRRQDDPDDACGEGEQRALREQLPDEPPTSRAERAPDRHLPASRSGAREQEIGRVGAGDQQHQGDGTRQYKKAPADVADRGIPEQRDVEAGVEDRSPAGGRSRRAAAGIGLARHDSLPPATTGRVAGAEPRPEQLDVADRTLQRDARREARHGGEEVHPAVRLRLRILRQELADRGPHLHVFVGELEPRRHHADHGEAAAVE